MILYFIGGPLDLTKRNVGDHQITRHYYVAAAAHLEYPLAGMRTDAPIDSRHHVYVSGGFTKTYEVDEKIALYFYEGIEK